jgi:hypothetical protein
LAPPCGISSSSKNKKIRIKIRTRIRIRTRDKMEKKEKEKKNEKFPRPGGFSTRQSVQQLFLTLNPNPIYNETDR